MDPLVWSILLLVVGLLLVLLEVFIPSGGIMGFLAVTAVATSIVLAFVHGGLETGLVFVGAAAVGVPVMLVLAFRYWPSTPMGRRVLLDLPTSQDVLPEQHTRESLRQLIGQIGVAKTVMLPSGAVTVGGRSHEAMSQGMAIEAGTRVRVVAVQGHSLVVRPVEADDEPEPAASDDVLTRPIESLGLNPIDDPLT